MAGKVKMELDRMESTGVITLVTEPTDYGSHQKKVKHEILMSRSTRIKLFYKTSSLSHAHD